MGSQVNNGIYEVRLSVLPGEVKTGSVEWVSHDVIKMTSRNGIGIYHLYDIDDGSASNLIAKLPNRPANVCPDETRLEEQRSISLNLTIKDFETKYGDPINVVDSKPFGARIYRRSGFEIMAFFIGDNIEGLEFSKKSEYALLADALSDDEITKILSLHGSDWIKVDLFRESRDMKSSVDQDNIAARAMTCHEWKRVGAVASYNRIDHRLVIGSNLLQYLIAEDKKKQLDDL